MLLRRNPLITQVFTEQLLRRSSYNNNNFKGTVQSLKKLHILGRRSQVNSKLFMKSRLGKEGIREEELPREEQSTRKGRRV